MNNLKKLRLCLVLLLVGQMIYPAKAQAQYNTCISSYDMWYDKDNKPCKGVKEYQLDNCTVKLNWDTGECHVSGGDIKRPLFNIYEEKKKWVLFVAELKCYSIAQAVKNLYIEDGVKSICDGAFASLRNLDNVYFNSSDLNTIGHELFYQSTPKNVYIKNPQGTKNPLKFIISTQDSRYYDKDCLGSVIERTFGFSVDKIRFIEHPDDPKEEYQDGYMMEHVVIDRNIEVHTLEGTSKADTKLPFFPASGNQHYSFEFGSSVTTTPTSEFMNMALYDNYATNMDVNYMNISHLKGKLSYEGKGLKHFELPANTRVIDNTFFQNCQELETLNIPWMVQEIAPKSFMNCKMLTTITLPVNLESIGSQAFEGCEQLDNILLGSNLNKIEERTFYGCKALREVAFAPACKIASIGKDAFAGCEQLEYFEMPNSVKELPGINVFANCSMLKTVVLSSNLKNISDNTFLNCDKLNSITIPASVGVIGNSAFAGCTALEKVVIEDSPQQVSVNEHAYSEPLFSANIKDFHLGRNIRIPSQSLVDGTVQKLTIGEQVTSLPVRIANVTSTITSLADDAPALNESAFHADTYSNAMLIANEKYVNADGWKKFKNTQFGNAESASLTDTDASDLKYTFDNETKTLTISSINADQEYAIPHRGSNEMLPWSKFKDVAERIVLNGKITQIGVNAFNGFKKLKEVSIPSTVANIGLAAFVGCTDIKSIQMGATTPPKFILNTGAVIPESQASTYKVFEDDVYSQASLYLENSGAASTYNTAAWWKKFGNNIISLSCGPNIKVQYTPQTQTLSITSSSSDAKTFDYVEANTYGSHTPWVRENIANDIKSVVFKGNFTRIGNALFADCPNLESVTLPEGLEEIGDIAFTGTKISSITIPNSVKKIGMTAFSGCKNLTSVTLSDNLEEVSPYLFDGCDNLESIVIPSSATAIGRYAFAECPNLKSVITYADSKITTVDEDAFRNCSSLTRCILPQAIEFIGEEAFYGCTSLASIQLPTSLRQMGTSVFYGCNSLSSINIPTSLAALPDGTFLGCTALKKIDIPATMVSLGNSSFQNTGFETFTIPEHITRIPDNFLSGCASLKEVNIPNAVIEIGEAAFHNCTQLTNITLPEGLKVLSSSLFESCTALQNVAIPNTVVEIQHGTFRKTGITSITIPKSVQKIGDLAFYESNINTINVEANEMPIAWDYSNNRNSTEYSAFSANTYTSANVYVPNKPQYQYDSFWSKFSNLHAFTEGTNDNINFELVAGTLYITTNSDDMVFTPNYTAENLPAWTSQASNIKRIDIGSNISGLGQYIFAGLTNVEEIDLRKSNVENIYDHAFDGCTSLRVVYLPDNLGKLGDGAFKNCPSLEYVYCSKASTGSYTNAAYIFDADNNVSLRVPTPANYSQLTYWNAKEKVAYLTGYCGAPVNMPGFELTEELTEGRFLTYTVDGNMLKFGVSDAALAEITYRQTYEALPDVALEMKDFASYNEVPWHNLSSYIKSIDFGNTNMTRISKYAFNGLSNINQVILPESIKEIGAYSFRNTNLNTLLLPSGLTKIDESAFENTPIEYISIPESVTQIGARAFKNTKLEKTALPEGFTKLFAGTFENCTNLKDVKLPSTLTTIYANAFNGCTSLESIVLPESVSVMEYDIFSNCTKLKEITILRNTPITLAANPFNGLTCGNITLNVPKHRLNTYKAAAKWNAFDIKDGILALTDANNTLVRNIYDVEDITYTRNGTAGNYGTFCMPFAIDLSKANCFEKVYTIHDMGLYNEETQRLRIFFREESKDMILPAGTPIIAKLNGNVELRNAEKVAFGEYAETQCTPEVRTTRISVFNWNEGAGGLTPPRDDMELTFSGTYSGTTAEELGLSDGQFKSFNTNATFGNKTGRLSAFRAYITQIVHSSVMVKGIDTDFSLIDDDDATFIEHINSSIDNTANNKAYTIDGKSMNMSNDKANLNSGIYIINGKKILKK